MGNTWIVDLRHYLDPSGAFPNLPSRARLLAEYFAIVVVDATANLDEEPTVRCRRRPGRRPCTGIVMSYPGPTSSIASIGTAPCAVATDLTVAGKTRSGLGSRKTPRLVSDLNYARCPHFPQRLLSPQLIHRFFWSCGLLES